MCVALRYSVYLSIFSLPKPDVVLVGCVVSNSSNHWLCVVASLSFSPLFPQNNRDKTQTVLGGSKKPRALKITKKKLVVKLEDTE